MTLRYSVVAVTLLMAICSRASLAGAKLEIHFLGKDPVPVQQGNLVCAATDHAPEFGKLSAVSARQAQVILSSPITSEEIDRLFVADRPQLRVTSRCIGRKREQGMLACTETKEVIDLPVAIEAGEYFLIRLSSDATNLQDKYDPYIQNLDHGLFDSKCRLVAQKISFSDAASENIVFQPRTGSDGGITLYGLSLDRSISTSELTEIAKRQLTNPPEPVIQYIKEIGPENSAQARDIYRRHLARLAPIKISVRRVPPN